MICIPPAAHDLSFNLLRMLLALALQDTRCIKALNDFGWVLEDSIGGRLEASAAWRLLGEHH